MYLCLCLKLTRYISLESSEINDNRLGFTIGLFGLLRNVALLQECVAHIGS